MDFRASQNSADELSSADDDDDDNELRTNDAAAYKN